MLVKTVLVVFRNWPLRTVEINQFRGYLNEQLAWQDDFFHNHTSEPGGVIYRYPRIHYRSFRGRATLFGIQEGYDAIDALIRTQVDRQPDRFGAVERLEQRTNLRLDDSLHTYTLHQWMGLNTIKNRDGSVTDLMAIWQDLPDEARRWQLLERSLTAQLLKFCGEMGVRLPRGELCVQIRAVGDAGRHRLRSQTGQPPFQAFDVRYESNLVLPDYVAFGKGVSKGFGWQTGH
ncbi:CRISPR-associated endonuclease Cas6 [Larkinella sp. VNQ87]|uniref:CRISPR-associated endonuclease Cas6 n=1 Tax=Larkinella sp. VNQ87 TaxID=3400921 RepID=UPI003C05F178